MIVRLSHRRVWPRRNTLPRAAVAMALLALGIGLSGCSTSVSDIKDDLSLDNASLAFVDPARYDYFDCKQLQTERKNIANHIEDSKRMMAKADTGFAGPLVAEMVYRNDYIANIGQSRLAEQTWKRNKCKETPPDPLAATAAAPSKGTKGARGPSRSGSAVY
jgi:hypothetical protein